MNFRTELFVLASVLAFSAFAETEERTTFGKWRIGFGGAFNARVSSDVGMRNLRVPSVTALPSATTREQAMAKALAGEYDGGGFIRPDELNNGFDTENWKLPVSAYKGNGRFVLENSYQEVASSSFDNWYNDASDSRSQFGLSIEASRELWIHDENDEHRWGVDFVAAFSYFFARDLYSAAGEIRRTDNVRDGVIQTEAVDADAMYDYDQGWDSPIGGLYGYGNFNRTYLNPAFGFAGIGRPQDMGGPTHGVGSSSSFFAHGDYQELEMLFMFRPWYELTDWWRVFAEAGLGVSWGRFDTEFRGPGISRDETFSQWDCYGVVGLGTAFRYKQFDIMLDVLGRFLRDDLDVDGQYLKGTIDRSDWGLRLMLGYSF